MCCESVWLILVGFLDELQEFLGHIEKTSHVLSCKSKTAQRPMPYSASV